MAGLLLFFSLIFDVILILVKNLENLLYHLMIRYYFLRMMRTGSRGDRIVLFVSRRELTRFDSPGLRKTTLQLQRPFHVSSDIQVFELLHKLQKGPQRAKFSAWQSSCNTLLLLVSLQTFITQSRQDSQRKQSQTLSLLKFKT